MNRGLKLLLLGLLIAVIIGVIVGGCIYVISKKKSGVTLMSQTERFTTSNTPWNSAIDQFVYEYVSSELGEKPSSN